MERSLDTSYDGRDLPEGWVVWSEDEGVVVTYKPDVFNAKDHPRPCLPVIMVTGSKRGTAGGREEWRVSFHIEADVKPYELERYFADYDEAIDYMINIAQNFVDGEYDFEEFYAKGDARYDYIHALEREISK
ncbi:MAG: DUF5820 family protein [Halobacteria archaeon]|nr:DUF5820 family protein [Halobacteria archaeon]